MKKIIVVISAVLLFVSCNVSFNGDSLSGNGNIKKETRNVGSFHGVESSGSIDVEISSGDNFSVVVEDDENVLPAIVTRVENGILKVRYKDNTSINDDHAKVYIEVQSLDRIISSGSANITMNDGIKNNGAIAISVSGSGDIEGRVDAPKVSASIGGSGNISLKGRTKDFDGEIGGSGDLKCSDLQSENASVSIAGSGNAHVFASVHLKANTAGSGDIYYRGNPQSPEINSVGSGSVKPE
ncbi:MAG: head GIN domain-containing protein [Ginsengibacter sp.]